MGIADAALLVDQVQGWPVPVVVSTPGLAVIVDRDRVGDVEVDQGLPDIVDVSFVVELRVVVADHDQPCVLVLLMPAPQRGDRSHAVYSTKGPHVDGNYLAS